MKQIQKEHVALIIKYTGISFITGGLSHGFFSGERQIITSLVGVVFFIVGTLLEQKPEERDYLRTIVFSSILAVSIGALTGGLQHFPDSPDRSAWLVPVGFIVSIYAYLSLQKEVIFQKLHMTYIVGGSVFFILVSALLYTLVQAGYLWAGEHVHGGNAHHVGESVVIEQQVNGGSISTSSKITKESEVHFKGDGHIDHDH